MTAADMMRELAQNLHRNRTRTFLTGLAVAWGIFMLVVLLGVARGMVNSMDSEFTADKVNLLEIYGGRTVYPYRGYEAGRQITLENADMAAIAHDNPTQVKSTFAAASADTAVLTTPKGRVAGGLNGVFAEQINTDPITITEGRFIDRHDLDRLRKSIVISQRTANLLFGDTAEVTGRTVNSMGLAWKVVGIYKHPWRNANYIPFTTLKMLTGSDQDVDKLIVATHNLSNADDAAEVEATALATLARRHNFDPGEGSRGAVYIFNHFTSAEQGKQATSIMRTAMWVIGILTMLTGIVGISNIMFVAVKERTHEIGIRRAIGAKPRRILLDIVAESVAITLISGDAGLVGGMLAMEGVKMIPQVKQVLVNPGIDLAMALQVTAVLICAGALAGLLPAIKATKVKPVEALRDE